MTLQLNEALEGASAPLAVRLGAERPARGSASNRWVDLATCARGEAWHG